MDIQKNVYNENKEVAASFEIATLKLGESLRDSYVQLRATMGGVYENIADAAKGMKDGVDKFEKVCDLLYRNMYSMFTGKEFPGAGREVEGPVRKIMKEEKKLKEKESVEKDKGFIKEAFDIYRQTQMPIMLGF